MRIISGSHKGRRFSPPKNFSARPTTDFAKENLFNVLHAYLDFEGLCVLDLFAGTGSISFEFCSRGAKRVLAVEGNMKHLNFIKKNRQLLGFEKQLEVLKADCFKYLVKAEGTFDLIFADPPYKLKQVDQLPRLILDSSLTTQGTLLVFEHSSEYDFSSLAEFLEKRKYGSVFFSLFRK